MTPAPMRHRNRRRCWGFMLLSPIGMHVAHSRLVGKTVAGDGDLVRGLCEREAQQLAGDGGEVGRTAWRRLERWDHEGEVGAGDGKTAERPVDLYRHGNGRGEHTARPEDLGVCRK